MIGTDVKTLVITTTLAALATARVAVANAASDGDQHTPSPTTVVRPSTPNDCIRLNGGDYNACNVGRGGSGDDPCLPVDG